MRPALRAVLLTQPLRVRVANIVRAAGGALFDPSDLTSLYQSPTGGSTGATGQPVGIMLDKSYMGGQTAASFIGGRSELVSNGGFSGTTGWTNLDTSGFTASGGQLTITNNGTNPGKAYQAITTVVGKWYRFQIELVSISAGFGRISFVTVLPVTGDSVTTAYFNSSTPAVATGLYQAVATTTYIVFGHRNDTNAVGVWKTATLKEIPGFHALAPSDAARPTLHASGYVDFDGVDDVLNAVVTALGSNVSVYHRTQAGAHVWLTGQTIGAGNYALSTTDWRKAAIIPGGVTSAQQAVIEAWGLT